MFLRLFAANLKMIYRNRQALFWALFFPLIFVMVFGVFRFDQPPSAAVLVVDHAGDQISAGLIDNLRSTDMLAVTLETDEAAARQSLADGEVGYVLVLPEGLAQQAGAPGGSAQITLLFDEANVTTNSMVRSILQRTLDGMNMALQGARPVVQLSSQAVSAHHVSYFDFLLPGFVGMAVMTYGVIGMASVMALYRQQKILKRIKATPLKVRTFFTAQVVAYLALSLLQTVIVLAAGMLVFGAKVYGSLAWVFPLVVLANLTFLNLGFIVGSFSKTVEAASGMGNAVTMPMMFFSGVFFPTDSLPKLLQQVVQFLPLTPLLEALRGVMLDARPVWEYPGALGLLGIWVVVTAVVAVRTFRFE